MSVSFGLERMQALLSQFILLVSLRTMKVAQQIDGLICNLTSIAHLQVWMTEQTPQILL